jgi:hypothetical protein
MVSSIYGKSKSFNILNNGVNLGDSYYNDRQKIYLKRSRFLTSQSVGYQSKDISYSIRRKYDEKKIERVMHERNKT